MFRSWYGAISMSATALALSAVFAGTVGAEENRTPPLRVSLFKWVPDQAHVQQVISARWKKVSAVPIEFVDWDGYEEDPPSDLDVFEYDALFIERFVRHNFVAPLDIDEIDERDDLLPFALRGAMVDGTVYGIPRLTCAPVLIYRSGDRAVEEAKSLKDLHVALGDSTSTTPKPEQNSGLLIDLSGGTTCACFYLDALFDIEDRYTIDPELPAASALRDDAIANLRTLTAMAGKAQATYKNWDGQRARWFGEGAGRAFVGYTERLWYVPKAAHSQIRVRSLPLADENATNTFFVDVLSINPLLDKKRRKLALEFANFCASRDVVLECLLPKDDQASSQYLLPARKSVLSDRELHAAAPLYADLMAIVGTEPYTFRIGEEIREWLESTEGYIQFRVTE